MEKSSQLLIKFIFKRIELSEEDKSSAKNKISRLVVYFAVRFCRKLTNCGLSISQHEIMIVFVGTVCLLRAVSAPVSALYWGRSIDSANPFLLWASPSSQQEAGPRGPSQTRLICLILSSKTKADIDVASISNLGGTTLQQLFLSSQRGNSWTWGSSRR